MGQVGWEWEVRAVEGGRVEGGELEMAWRPSDEGERPLEGLGALEGGRALEEGGALDDRAPRIERL